MQANMRGIEGLLVRIEWEGIRANNAEIKNHVYTKQHIKRQIQVDDFSN